MVFNYQIFIEGKISGLQVSDDELKFTGEKAFLIKKSYVTGFQLLQQLPMAKVEVELTYYDFFGDNNKLRFDMHDSEYRALKRDLQK